MPRLSPCLYVLALLVAMSPCAIAAPPSDVLLPDSTKFYLSVPDLDSLQARWNQTQLGQMMADPAMRSFAEGLRRQLEGRWNKTGMRLNLTLADLQSIQGGEVCMAAVQPQHDAKQHAAVLLVDVTGHRTDAQALVARITEDLVAQGGKRSVVRMGPVEVTHVAVPAKGDETEPLNVYYTIHQDELIAVDHEGLCRDMLARFSGPRPGSLAELAAYSAAMQHCRQAAGEATPQLRWFAEPFGLIELWRAADGGRRRRGTDMLKVLSNQGFRAIQGIGGVAVLASGQHEMLQYAFVYAPRPYQLAARMLDFPNSTALEAQPWIGRRGAMYLTFHWNMREAFEFSKTLVDEIAGDEIFDEVLKSIKLDPNGPQVDIRQGLVAHLSDRATFVNDFRLPITPESQRFMLALELTNPDEVRKTVDKAMEADPEVKKRVFDGHVIWEILGEEEEEEVVEPVVDGVPGFGQFGFEQPEEEEEEQRASLPNSAITVAHGHLIIASHVDYVRDMLSEVEPGDQLAEAVDYLVVNDALKRLGAGKDCARVFSRTDELFRATYQLLRQGKMPEAKTLLGKMLNRLLGPDEEGVLRKQQIDGSKLPDYQLVRRYLGPAGAYIRSVEDGWMITGCLLSKEIQ